MVGSWLRPAVRGLLATICALMLGGGFASGQTLTTGSIRGVIRDEGSAVLAGVSVTAIDAATGVSHAAMTGADGAFVFSQLMPGQYILLAERLGYRPKRVLDVPVQPLAETPVAVELVAAPPPVGSADIEEYRGATLATGGTREWFAQGQLDGYPDLRRELSDVGRLSSLSDRDASLEGLPAWMTGVVVDGIPTAPVRHPALADEPLRTAAFPLSSMEAAELVTNPADVEWPGSAPGLLAGYTLRGTQELRVRGYALWSGGPLSTSSPGAGDSSPPTDVQGAFVLAGPLAGDSAHILLGVQGQRLARTLGPAWSGADATALQTAAQQGLGLILAPYFQTRTVQSEAVSAFTRVDWQVTPVHAVELRASFATMPKSDPAFDLSTAGAGPVTTFKGTDVSVGATLRSEVSEDLTSELRVGVDRGTRDYTAVSDLGSSETQAPFVTFAPQLLTFGTDPLLPGSFTQTTLRAGETLQKHGGAQDLKFGVELAAPKYNDTYRPASAGALSFGSLAAVQSRDAVFSQATGTVPAASFSVPRISLFLQDHWAALPGLDLVAGLRADRDQLPSGDVARNAAWDSLTSLSNATLPSSRLYLSPRASLSWDLGEQGRWIVNAAGGLYYDRLDPAVLAQVLTDDGRTQVRRGVGVLDAWPALTTSLGVSTLASSLTLPGPKMDAPRTARGSASLTVVLGEGTRLKIGGIVRHTDYLPRRTDLNLTPTATGQDQFGRPVYGELVQDGGVLAAQPGSNRRFPGFDVVTGITTDGSSDYRAVTVSLERAASQELSFLASYTYSQTTDNWAGAGMVTAAGFAPYLGPTLSDWADGTSDFDVPQRFVAGARLTMPRGLKLVALYRYSSGLPFTPGFGPGVDANGDGVAGNDPAYITNTVPGTSTIMGQWSCLSGQSGTFAARNSCRGPAIQTLDARAALRVLSVAGTSLEVRVDALDLVHSGRGVPDSALYLVDPSGSVASDGAGHVTVPLVANPHFGKALGFTAPGATILLGLALNW